MFTVTEELKGLVIDYDSFENISVEEIRSLNNEIKCVIITSKFENKEYFDRELKGINILYLNASEKNLSPNIYTHKKILDIINLKTTEIGYFSSDYFFLKRAYIFLSTTIWISDIVDYDSTKALPDIIIDDIASFIKILKGNSLGFFGENYIFSSEKRLGTVTQTSFNVGNEKIPIYIAGRYFGSNHYMKELHPYSRAISLNKREKSRCKNKFNIKFKEIFFGIIDIISKNNIVYGVLSVPVKPSKQNRFLELLDYICQKCNLKNLSSEFLCIENYSDQKELNSEEREKNIKGVFKYNGNLKGKTIILIDDIITTGATLRECIKVLQDAEAKKIIIVVLAINQIEAYYYTSNIPKVMCPVCKDIMRLNANGETKEFFYSCIKCYENNVKSKTIGFGYALKKLQEKENEELKKSIENEDFSF